MTDVQSAKAIESGLMLFCIIFQANLVIPCLAIDVHYYKIDWTHS